MDSGDLSRVLCIRPDIDHVTNVIDLPDPVLFGQFEDLHLAHITAHIDRAE